MNRLNTYVLTLLAILLLPSLSAAQYVSGQYPVEGYDMYTSVQGNQVNSYSGNYSKTTKKLEYSNVTISTVGPIQYTVTPATLSIGPEESKTWNGTITADPAQIPLAGTRQDAVLKADYTIGFSRPKGTGSDGTVISTHTCRGCDYHGEGVHGEHEKVEIEAKDSIKFNVISLSMTIDAPDSVCYGDSVQITANTYPESSSIGTVEWDDGTTGRTRIWVANSSRTFTATFKVQGITYKDSISIYVAIPSNFSFTGAAPPLFEGWSRNLNKVDEIKNKTKGALQAIPARVTISGPTVTLDYGKGDCCNNGNVIADGKKTVKGTLTAGINASVPMASPPWTAAVEIEKRKFGYVFKLQLQYGLFLDVGANFEGVLGYRWDECVPEDCFIGSIGLDCPMRLSITANGQACVSNPNRIAKRCLGRKQNGARCSRMTKNWCQYCSNYNGPNVPPHSSQSRWCFPCPSFNITPAAISSSLYGKVTYNDESCTEGIRFKAGIGPVVFSTGASIMGYDLSWSYTIWNGAQIYP